MKTFLKLYILFGVFYIFNACQKDDDGVEPLRDYETQYLTDISNIEEFMKTHYLTVVHHPGFDDDLDVTYTKITIDGNQQSIWDQTTYPIRTRMVTVKQNNKDINYKIY
jgi:hypothetical protein